MSVILREAFERWKQMRDDFELYRHAQYQRAVAELRGELLNRRGQTNHIEAYSLFLGPLQRALAYASEDLQRWWAEPGNGRLTVEEFENEWLRARNYDEETTWPTT